MKVLMWFTNNIKVISFVAGVVCVAAGESDIGHILINKGAI